MMKSNVIPPKISGNESLSVDLPAERLGSDQLIRIVEAKATAVAAAESAKESSDFAVQTLPAMETAVEKMGVVEDRMKVLVETATEQVGDIENNLEYLMLMTERERMKNKLDGFQRGLQAVKNKRRAYFWGFFDADARPWEEEDAELEEEEFEDDEDIDETDTSDALDTDVT